MRKPRIDVKPSDFIWGVERTDEEYAGPGRGDWHMVFYVRHRESGKYGRRKWEGLMLQKVCFLRGGPSNDFRDRRYNLDNSIGMLFEKMKDVAGVGIMKSAIKKNENPFANNYKIRLLEEV